MLDIINVILLFIMVIFLIVLIKYIVDLSKLEEDKKNSINITSIKDIIFINKRVIQKMDNKEEQWLKDVRKLVFKVKSILFLYIISLSSILVVTIIILSKCNYAYILYKHLPILLWDFLIIMICIIEPASSIINNNLRNKVDQCINFTMHELPKILIAQCIDFFVFFIFAFSILIINHYAYKFVINYFSLYKENFDFSLCIWVFSILVYQTLITPIINIIIKKLKKHSIISESYNVKIRTYLHIIFIYAYFKLAKFSGDSNVEKYFSVQFEAITIFFMIDVYFDKKKSSKDSREKKLKVHMEENVKTEVQEAIKELRCDIENLKQSNNENVEEIINKIDTNYKNLEAKIHYIENTKANNLKGFASSILKKYFKNLNP